MDLALLTTWWVSAKISANQPSTILESYLATSVHSLEYIHAPDPESLLLGVDCKGIIGSDGQICLLEHDL